MRPHDLEVHREDPSVDGAVGRAVVGEIARIVRVGFEVRVEVATADQVVVVTLTRTQFQALGVQVGSRAWVRATPGAPTVSALGSTPGEEELVAS